EHLAHFFFGHRAEAAAARRSAEVHRPAARLSPGAALRRRLLVHPPVRAELVVLLALRWIAEDFVRLVDLLEARLRRLVARVDVRVMPSRKLPVRLLDFLLGRRLRDAERGVVVFEVHRIGTLPPGADPSGLPA